MAELMDIRARDGIYEILTAKGSGGDVWEPLATAYVRWKYLDFAETRGVTIDEALCAEGWIPPDEPLPVCAARSRIDTGAICTLRKGHDSRHESSFGTSWEEGY